MRRSCKKYIISNRLYSIASSQEYLAKSRPDTVNKKMIPLDLLLSVVEYKTPNGKQKRGFCSNYLANSSVGTRVAIHLKASPTFHFKPLSDGTFAPTLLIGAGSGLAPFRGFWQTLTLSATPKTTSEHGWMFDQALKYLVRHIGKALSCENII